MKKYILLSILSLFITFVTAQSFNEAELLERLKTLSSDTFQGRRTGEKGNAMARKYLIKEFKKLNAPAFGSNYEHPFAFKTGGKQYNGVNVLVQFKGIDCPDKYIVVSAHYDHLGIQKGKIYNGADDDVSGISALFSFAEYLHKTLQGTQ